MAGATWQSAGYPIPVTTGFDAAGLSALARGEVTIAEIHWYGTAVVVGAKAPKG